MSLGCFFLFFCSLFLLFYFTSSASQSDPSELRSLLEFKKGIQSDPLDRIVSAWNLSNLRNQSSCPVSWPGITCDSTTNSVTGIILDRLSLSGDLKFSTLLNLKSLQNLSLSGNHFTGRLVPTLGSMSSLQHLDLSDNEFSGPIPGRIAELWNLKYINLSRNGFEGGFPVGLPVPFRNLQQLRVLDLHSNKFRGNVREVLSELINLDYLDLSDNEFYGELGGLSVENVSGLANTVRFVNFSGNKLIGGFLKAEVIALFRSLEVLDLSNNGISGKLPSFESMLHLRVLQLRNNQLFGAIAEELLNGSMPIEELDLSGNGISGGLPSDIGNLGSLKLLNLSNNGLSGELPIELSKLAYLQYLDLSGNKFKGKIPDKLPSSLIGFNVSYNDLSGTVPENLRTKFGISSFHPGNSLLVFPGGQPTTNSVPDQLPANSKHHSSKRGVTIGIIVGAIVATLTILVLLAYHRVQQKEFHGRSGFGGQTTVRDAKVERSARSSLFKFQSNVHRKPASLSFSNDHLLTSKSRSLSGQTEFANEIIEHDLPGGAAASSAPSDPNVLENYPTTSGRKSSPGSPLASSPHFVQPRDQSVKLDVYSPDRLAGELFFLDASLAFTAEELSRAPAEVLGRSSHGTLYKATLDGGHMLTVKWLRVGLVKHKKEFAKEVKRIGSIKHPNIVPLRAYYWGPREQERLLLADYIEGDSLALHLYETTPRRYSLLSFNQRLKVAADVARCLLYIHDRGMLHGNLKPTNILLEGPDYNVRLTDYGLHRLMTPAGIAEQILNLGALGYCAPELANASKAVPPSFKADVYAFGVILMELLTRRSAGDIISGQSGAVDLTDWVRLCDEEGRRMDCIDRDIASGEEPSKAMDDLLGISLRCILPVNERPNIRQVLEDLCSISV
ncbi:hypothetical protein MANES_12G141100v8 [Manihot esculenta]|uniref:Uncharacterized protein n=1 Tax=Manihot esculenta TaxID=3983 RepID=A0ACB7GRJ0_MANES|nr:hypothetical protein MANES_12G141100v8 [Manihot esculenta]